MITAAEEADVKVEDEAGKTSNEFNEFNVAGKVGVESAGLV